MHPPTTNDLTNAGDRTPERPADTRQRIEPARAHREEQLVVLPARQQERATSRQPKPSEHPGSRHPIDLYPRRHTTRDADPITIDQKAVTEIDHGGRQFATGERLASPQASHGAAPPGDGGIGRAPTSQSSHAKGGCAERARDEKLIARPRARTLDRARRRLAEEGNGQGQLATVREVAAGERRSDSTCPISHATDNVPKLGRRKPAGGGHRQQRSNGTPPHGRYVARVHLERASSERARAQPCSPEVHAFDQRVGGQEQRSPTGRDDGSVVSRTNQHPASGRHQAANLIEQSPLAAVGERLSQTSP